MIKIGDEISGFLLRLIRRVALRQKCKFTVVEFVNDYDHVQVLHDSGVEEVIPVTAILPSEDELAASGY